MRLIYIDEAGNTGRKADPDQPVHLIGSLIVNEDRVRSIEIALNRIAADCAGTISARGHRLSPHDLEFHGADLFGGSGVLKAMKPAERIAICRQIIEACHAESAVFGSCGIDKLKLVGGHPHLRAFQFTLERVQDYLAQTGGLGLIVADEHRELEEEIIRDLAFSKEASTEWGYGPTSVVNIVDTVHFVKSKHNRLVQACDVLTYLRLKGLNISRRLAAGYSVAHALSHGQDFPSYREKTVKPAERAVLDLAAVITRFEQFHKIWPQ